MRGRKKISFLSMLAVVFGLLLQIEAVALASHEAAHAAQRLDHQDLSDCGLCVTHRNSGALPTLLAPALSFDALPTALEAVPVFCPGSFKLGLPLARAPPRF